MSSVFSMLPDGISNAWTTKVMINNPATSTEAMPSTDSASVSLCLSVFSIVLVVTGNGLS
jgi:hypothetical protein